MRLVGPSALTVAPGIVIPTIVVTESSTVAGLPVTVLDDDDGGLEGGFAGGGVCGFGGGAVWVGGGVVCGDSASHSTSRDDVSMLRADIWASIPSVSQEMRR
jgi:hypothetical protein